MKDEDLIARAVFGGTLSGLLFGLVAAILIIIAKVCL